MRKNLKLVCVLGAVILGMTSCGAEKAEQFPTQSPQSTIMLGVTLTPEPTVTIAVVTEASNKNENGEPEKTKNELTGDTVLAAVRAYCLKKNESLTDSDNVYWVVSAIENKEITVKFRSYTGAFVFYHVDTESGDVTTTEYVEGITETEIPGDEVFNIYDYIE